MKTHPTLDLDGCTCDPRYLTPGGNPDDPAGHGDTSKGCPVHDPDTEDGWIDGWHGF
jgi:hypothetical protein